MPPDIHEVALRALSRRALSRREMSERLQRKGFGAGAVRAELARLSASGLLDDGQLAESVVRVLLGEGKGRRAVAAALRRRGVDREAASSAVAAIAVEAEDEALALAVARAARKYPYFRRLPQERRKMLRYLLARGFGVAAISRAISARAGEDADEVEVEEVVEPGDP